MLLLFDFLVIKLLLELSVLDSILKRAGENLCKQVVVCIGIFHQSQLNCMDCQVY